MELFKLFGTILVDNSDAIQGIDNTTSKAEQARERISTAFSKIGSAAVNVGRTIATGLAVGATAMAGLTVKALNLSGDLEQNMGGSEAVFAEYAESMQETAGEAFANMGLSASDFLATANKMGALFQGSGFTIEESADLASEAMQRAADVASIMGIDTASAMEAVAGAAKGNFTMMDNLGVAMNETSLEAYALATGCEKAYSAMSQQERIGLAMQMFLDKTAYAAGNYAKENDTLAGSLGTAKAALTNFLDGSGTVDQLVDAVMGAATVVLRNIQTLLPRLVQGITQLIQQLMPYLPAILEELLPGIIEGGTVLLTGLIEALPDIMQILIDQVPAILEMLGEAFTEAWPVLVEVLQDLLGQLFPSLDIDTLFSGVSELFNSLSESMSGLFTELETNLLPVLTNVFNTLSPIILQFIETMLPQLITMFTSLVAPISEIVNALLPVLATWMQTLIPIYQTLLNLLTPILNLVTSLLVPIANLISTATPLITVVGNLISMALTPLQPILDSLSATIGTALTPVVQALTPAFQALEPIFETLTTLIQPLMSLFGSLSTTYLEPLINIVSVLATTLTGVLGGALSAIQPIVESVMEIFGSLITFITGVFCADWSLAWTGIVDVFKGIFNLIPAAVETVINLAIGVINGIIRGINAVVSAVGINPIGYIDEVKLNRLEEGGVLEKGQIGFLEGTGAEAVVPLDQNQAWIHAVAEDMAAAGIGGGMGNSEDVRELKEAFRDFVDALPEMLTDAFASMKFDVNNREFARMVKAVN